MTNCGSHWTVIEFICLSLSDFPHLGCSTLTSCMRCLLVSVMEWRANMTRAAPGLVLSLLAGLAGAGQQFGLTAYGEPCTDSCKQRGFPYAWCHKKPSWNGTFLSKYKPTTPKRYRCRQINQQRLKTNVTWLSDGHYGNTDLFRPWLLLPGVWEDSLPPDLPGQLWEERWEAFLLVSHPAHTQGGLGLLLALPRWLLPVVQLGGLGRVQHLLRAGLQDQEEEDGGQWRPGRRLQRGDGGRLPGLQRPAVCR